MNYRKEVERRVLIYVKAGRIESLKRKNEEMEAEISKKTKKEKGNIIYIY